MQRDQALELVGQVGAPLRLAAREGLVLQVPGLRQVVDTRQHRTEHLAVAHDAPDGDPAEAHAVITALAPDETGALALAAYPVVGECDLQRGVDRLGAGVAEKDVVEGLARQRHQALGQFEGQRVAHLEGGREIQRASSLGDGLDDRAAAVPGIDAPQAGLRIEHLPPLGREVVHALGTRQQSWRRLELAIGRKRHPEGIQVCGGRSLIWGKRCAPGDIVHRVSSGPVGRDRPSIVRRSHHSSNSPGSAATTVHRKKVGQPSASTITPAAGPT